jgi:hypothetical protein
VGVTLFTVVGVVGVTRGVVVGVVRGWVVVVVARWAVVVVVGSVVGSSLVVGEGIDVATVVAEWAALAA